MTLIPVAVAHGDGIGPEIMDATLKILEEAGAPIEYHEVEIGEKCYLAGHTTGMDPKTWDVLRKCKAFLKAPITTPQGGGFKSLNVTIRTSLGLYANVRPCISYAPFVKTKHPKMDVVIVRENEEDLYAGIEYQQTPHVAESIKLISEEGSEKIVRYAFDFAVHHGRKKVTCFTKDNIMKLSDGLFHRTFDRIAKEYPQIESEHWIVDIGAAKLADTPEAFDVVVMPNLYGDILSDVAAQISGSVGLAGSANIGAYGAMFEAIHGSAPRRAGQNLANPSGLLLGAIQMLVYLGATEVAERIHNAWLATIEAGYHTYDIYKEGESKEKVGTKEFALAVCKHLGKRPTKLKAISYKNDAKIQTLHTKSHTNLKRELVGIDCFIYAPNTTSEALIKRAEAVATKDLNLSLITNRGARIHPDGIKETFCIEQWRLRYRNKAKDSPINPSEVIAMQEKLLKEGFDLIKTENLYTFDGVPMYSSAEW